MKRFWMVLAVLALLMVGGVVASAQEEEMMTYTVMLGGNEELGAFLVDEAGMTLYIFLNDEPGVSNCTGGCAENWPPLTVEEGVNPTLAATVSGRLGTITRDDSTRQVTYNGMPLYYWINDAQPGDATGQGAGDVWYVASLPTVGLGGNEELGAYLVGANGMTLYTFANDEAGVSNCIDGCAANWPPLTVESEDSMSVQPGLVGEYGVIERADGTLQVTFNEMPLYYWVNDAQPGDATGQGVNSVWFVAMPPTVSVAENEALGQILTGANGMTLYTFANDEAGVSNCTDGCAANWPPLTVAPESFSAGEGVTGELSAIERADGSLQITYNGAPLYYWINDAQPGDTTGHEVNSVWFVAQP